MKKVLFEKDILITFGEADPQGLLYYARVFDIAHQCLEEYWSQSRLGWKFWFENPDFAVPLKHASADYSLPLRAGVTYSVRLKVEKVGQSSIEFHTEFVGRSTEKDRKESHPDETHALVKTVHVFVNRKTFKKINIPESVLESLQFVPTT